ncbi:unnamed protein product [Calypogeia fissa]
MIRLFLSSGVECVPGLKSYAFFWFWSLASNRKGLPASNCSTYLVSSTFRQVSASRKTTHRTRSPEARVCRQPGDHLHNFCDFEYINPRPKPEAKENFGKSASTSTIRSLCLMTDGRRNSRKRIPSGRVAT